MKKPKKRLRKKLKKVDCVNVGTYVDKYALVDYTGAFVSKKQDGISYHTNIVGLISIRKKQRGKDFFGTALHEWLHQLFPWMREKSIKKLEGAFTELVYTKEFLRRAKLKKR